MRYLKITSIVTNMFNPKNINLFDVGLHVFHLYLELSHLSNPKLQTHWEGEGGMNWESGTETHTLLYVKLDSHWKLLHDAGSSNLVLWDNLEGRDGVGGRLKREGIYVYLCFIHIDKWQKPI